MYWNDQVVSGEDYMKRKYLYDEAFIDFPIEIIRPEFKRTPQQTLHTIKTFVPNHNCYVSDDF